MIDSTDASKITQEELDHIHQQVRLLRDAAKMVLDSWDEGNLAGAVRELSLILESTEEEE